MDVDERWISPNKVETTPHWRQIAFVALFTFIMLAVVKPPFVKKKDKSVSYITIIFWVLIGCVIYIGLIYLV